MLIGIDPRKLELPVTDATTIVDLRASMNDALSKLVAKGMRATIASSLVLPGASGVALDFVGKPGTARLVMSDPPIIPAASTGNGIDDALASLGRIAGRIESLPLEEIAGHLRSTAARLDKLVNDPAEIRTSAWPRVGSHAWSRLARRRRWTRTSPSGYFGRAWKDPG